MIAPRVATPARAARDQQPAEAETRKQMIREAAYLLAEHRAFGAGHEVDDWLLAEQRVDRWLANRGPARRYRPR
jgi:hypothetical protein